MVVRKVLDAPPPPGPCGEGEWREGNEALASSDSWKRLKGRAMELKINLKRGRVQ
jgi:hypothetical protein